MYYTEAGIKEFLKSYNFRPNDLLGQNFMMNEDVLERIVDAAEIKKDDTVLEIGSGIGNLTALLAQKAGDVLCVEKDQKYFPILKDALGDKLQSHTRTSKQSANVRLVFADIMKFNFQELIEGEYKVVANIPYYITGQIIEMLLLAKRKPKKIVLLVQKEVAERITASPGELSILAIAVQLYADTSFLQIVPKEDFYPRPKVDSAILVLDVLEKPRFEFDEKKFFKIIKACFAGKRKQIHNTLKNNLHVPEEKLNQIFAKGIVQPQVRPQELTLQQWHQIYTILGQ